MSSDESQTIREQSPDEPAEPNSAADVQSKVSGFNNPQARTIRPAGVHQLLRALIAIIAAAVAGTLIIRLHSTGTFSSRLFAGTNQFGEWTAIVAVVAGSSVAVAGLTLPPLLRLKNDVGATAFWWALGAYALIGAVAVSGPFWVDSGDNSFELSYFAIRIGLIAILMLSTGIGPFCGLILLSHAQRTFSEDPGQAAGRSISAILSARRDLQAFFVGATALITGTMIIIVGLQSALSAYNARVQNALSAYNAALQSGQDPNNTTGAAIVLHANDNPVNISSEALILYALFFAGLFAVVLVPAYTAWLNRATSFRDRLYPIPEDGRPPKSWYESRSDLEGLLGTNLGASSRFLVITGVLAPLIGTIIAVIIPAIHG
jgi:hypothetical protein